MHQSEESEAQFEQALRESADQFALEEQLREFERTKSLPDESSLDVVRIRIEEDSDTSSNSSPDHPDILGSNEGSDIDEDTLLEIALEISKEETTNQTQSEEYDNQDFTEEEILKISEIESNQDNTFTVIYCLRNDAADECIFCLDIPVRLEVVRRLRCMHIFHKDCFDDYFDVENDQKNKCPICKEAVKPESECWNRSRIECQSDYTDDDDFRMKMIKLRSWWHLFMLTPLLC